MHVEPRGHDLVTLGVTEIAAVGLQSHQQGGDFSSDLPPVKSVVGVLAQQRPQPTVEQRVEKDIHAMHSNTYVVERILLQCPEHGHECASERLAPGEDTAA